jgi:hypothetical protein
LNVPGLNALTVFRPGRPATPKTEVPNVHLPVLQEGLLRVVPSPNSVGAAPPYPLASYLAYAWTGGSANLNGNFPLNQKAGLVEVAPGEFTLVVDGIPVVTERN